MIINNDGTDAVTGTFSGLAEGATVTFNGANYTITYHGGTGNDVVLTDVTVTAPTVTLSVTNTPDASKLTPGTSIELNSNHDLSNIAPDGSATANDNELDYTDPNNPVYRINRVVQVNGTTENIVDHDLAYATLQLGNAASYTLTFADAITHDDRITVWDDTDAQNPVMLVSGQSYPAPSGDTVSLAIDGMIDSDVNGKEVLTATATSASGETASDAAAFEVISIALYIDADNNNGYNLPDESNAEGTLKQDSGAPGKYVASEYLSPNPNLDNEADGVPDFADGYNLDQTTGNADDIASDSRFVPVVVSLGPMIDPTVATINLSYSGSDPIGVTDDNGVYTPAAGDLRIWTKDGSQARNDAGILSSGDYVIPGVTFPASLLNYVVTSTGARQATVYIEGIRPVDSSDDSDRTITLTVNPNGDDNLSPMKPARVTINLVAPTPATPQNITAQANGSTIDLSWTDPGTDNTGYVVEQSADSTFASGVTNINIPSWTQATYSDTGLESPTHYYYRIFADNDTTLSTDYVSADATTSGGVTGEAPTITSISADPTPVIGTTTQLSAVVSSDGAYLWAIVAQPTGANAQFDSDSNQMPTVTFDRAGDYTFSLVASNAAGSSSPGTVNVIVDQTLTAIAISPASVSVPVSTDTQTNTQQFTGTAIDQFGTAMATQPTLTWSRIGDGSIDTSSGLYTSPRSGVTATVSASFAGITSNIATITLVVGEVVMGTALSTSLVSLTWPATVDSVQYDVFRDTAANFQPSYDNEVGISSTTNFEDETANAGVTYYYKIYSIESDGSSTAVGQTSVTLPVTDSAPDPGLGIPTNVRATGVNDLEILISWTNTLSNPGDFVIEISTDGVTWNEAGSAGPADRNYIVRDYGPQRNQFLQEGVPYYLRVSADVGTGFYRSPPSAATAATYVSTPSSYLDNGQDMLVIVGGNSQPMNYLLAGVTVGTDGTLQGQGNSVGAIWVHDVKEGYNAFITADPHDGGSSDSDFGMPSADSPNYNTGADVVNNDGSGWLYNEIMYEVNNRGIFDIGLIAYSHGGGIIANISNSLHAQGLPPFASVVFVATIDAVEYGTAADNIADFEGWFDHNPLSYSPATIWGAVGFNYWEPNGWLVPDGGGTHLPIRGMSMPGVTNYEIEFLEHSSIAVASGVLSGVENETDDLFFALSF